MKTQNFLNSIRLLTFTVLAMLFSFGTLANTSDDKNSGRGGGESTIVEVTVNESLDLEQWMLEESFFMVSESAVSEDMPLQNWMLNWNFEVNSNELTDQLYLENWMLDETNFKVNEKGSLECWMLNPENFKTEEEKELETISSWMMNNDFWTT